MGSYVETKRILSLLYRYCIVFLLWMLFWALLSHSALVSSALLPSPERVIARMFDLQFILTYVFNSLPKTFFWVLGSWCTGLLLTAFLSVFAAISRTVSCGLDLVFVAGRALPSVVAIPLFAAVLGSDRMTVAACTTFMVICYSEASFRESISSINKMRNILKETLDISMIQEMLIIVLPGAAHAWRAIAVQSFGIALVVTVAGEMILSFYKTVGDEVSQKAWLLNMVDLYAMVGWLVIWALIIKRITSLLPYLLETPGKIMIEFQGKNFI